MDRPPRERALEAIAAIVRLSWDEHIQGGTGDAIRHWCVQAQNAVDEMAQLLRWCNPDTMVCRDCAATGIDDSGPCKACGGRGFV